MYDQGPRTGIPPLIPVFIGPDSPNDLSADTWLDDGNENARWCKKDGIGQLCDADITAESPPAHRKQDFKADNSNNTSALTASRTDRLTVLIAPHLREYSTAPEKKALSGAGGIANCYHFKNSMGKFNDLDLENWRDCDVNTDSLWIIGERTKTGKHRNVYHGNFIPQIPYQLLSRYTKRGDVVLEPFMGSGTTLFECENLGRRYIGLDINSEMIEYIA